MKKYLITGFISLLPIALTIIIVKWLFDFFTTPFAGIIEHILLTYEGFLDLRLENHQTLVLFFSRVISLIFLFFLIFILGFLGRKYFFNVFLRLTNYVFMKIPFIKSIYRISKEVTKAVFSEGQKTFKQTVLVPFPSETTHSVGFITGEVPLKLKEAAPGIDVSVFIPTAPHPISGFLILTPKSFALDVDMTTEEAFKFLLSFGILHADEKSPQDSEKM